MTITAHQAKFRSFAESTAEDWARTNASASQPQLAPLMAARAPPAPDSVILRVSTGDDGLPMLSDARQTAAEGMERLREATAGLFG